MNKMLKLVMLVILGLSVAGCNSYKTEFNCGAHAGLGCKSLSEVDRLTSKNKAEANKMQIIKIGK